MKASLIIWLILSVLLLACQNKMSDSTQGLEYKIYAGKGGSVIKYGVAIRALIKKYYNDSLLATPTDSVIRLIRIDSLHILPFYVDALLHAKTGDSLVTIQRIDSAKLKEGLPEYARLGNKLITSIKIMEIIEDSLLGVIYENEAEIKIHLIDSTFKKKEKVLEDSTLAAFTKTIGASKTPNGIYTSISTRNSKKSKQIIGGDKVIVDYRAYTLAGKFIDGSFDSSGKSALPLSFQVGNSEVIPGFDEGIRLFRKGDTGRIIIPSLLAFGKFGVAGKVKPYENVYYDVRIRDVR